MENAIYIINKPEAAKLADVIAYMEAHGEPTIRAYWTGEAYIALEGSHRVAAAHALGLAVNVIKMGEDEELTDHDLQDLPETVTVAEALEYIDGGAAAYFVEVN